MKRTGRTVYLSGEARLDRAEKTVTDGGETYFFKNILVDERRGYAYKVTFASMYPNVTNPSRNFANPYGLYSFSTRELRRMADADALAFLGVTRSLAAMNRNIAVVGNKAPTGVARVSTENYQGNYVIKGDAMVTQSLSIGAQATAALSDSSVVTYYIELEEYDVSSDEEILLILNERAQDAQGVVE